MTAKPLFWIICMPPGRRLLLLAGARGDSDWLALRQSVDRGAQSEEFPKLQVCRCWERCRTTGLSDSGEAAPEAAGRRQ